LPFDELLDEFELELLDEFELELLEEFELESPDVFELELLDQLELELLDELELQLLEEFELELLDEFELELLEEFELELPAEAGCVTRAVSTARTTASGGEWPSDPSFAAAAATSPHAPNPAAYVFHCFGILLRVSTMDLAFVGIGVRRPVVPRQGESTVSRP
jgi:hypothetical protein